MKKTGDVDSSLCADLRSLSRAMTRLYNTQMPKISVNRKRSGGSGGTFRVQLPIRVTQVSVLAALDDLSWCCSGCLLENREGVSQVDLAQHLGVDTATMCRNMRVLVRENEWAEEKQNSKSGRGKLLNISETGRMALQEARPKIECLDNEIKRRICARGVNIERLSQDLSIIGEVLKEVEAISKNGSPLEISLSQTPESSQHRESDSSI
ncbi:MAG: MarR family winged helix-turn-helix transcriptional regulator [Candidatus Bruticola sp.]